MDRKFRFTSPFGRYSYPVVEAVEDAGYVREVLGSSTIFFSPVGRKGIFETGDERVARFLRRLKKLRPAVQFDEDLSAFPLSCTVRGCKWSYERSDDLGHRLRYQHMMNDHEQLMMGGPEADYANAAAADVAADKGDGTGEQQPSNSRTNSR